MKTRRKFPVSPLRYPGAKRWLAGYVLRSLAQNELRPKLFFEPFAGGASVSLAVLHSGAAQSVILNDRDPLVSSFWETLFFDTDWLIQMTSEADVTVEFWEKLKATDYKSKRDQAFKCLFLNRTSFSGIISGTSGPIGGRKQESAYKIDCRFNKIGLIKRILKISSLRAGVAGVWNLDWLTATKRVLRSKYKSDQMLMYFDPPFYNKADVLYSYYFRHADHEELRDYLASLEQPWILSYDHCDEIIEMYKGHRSRASDVNLIYTASQKSERGIGKELIVSNLPNMVSELMLGVGKNASAPRSIANSEDGGASTVAIHRDSENRIGFPVEAI